MFEILYSDANCEFELCVMDICEETKCVQSAHDFQIKLFVCNCMWTLTLNQNAGEQQIMEQ
jgi:hypothetical protein